MTYQISKEQILELYDKQKRSVYECAQILNVDHKTFRTHMRKHGIPIRPAAEYNYLCRQSHVSPSRETLRLPRSIAAHASFLCEGWHTEKTNHFNFCNTDPILVDLQLWMLKTVYQVRTEPRLVIYTPEVTEAAFLQKLYPAATTYIETSRKTPLVRIHAGGKRLGREVVENAYDILRSLE